MWPVSNFKTQTIVLIIYAEFLYNLYNLFLSTITPITFPGPEGPLSTFGIAIITKSLILYSGISALHSITNLKNKYIQPMVV